MVEALDPKNSIATKSAKGAKHVQKSTFEDFINNLGKTTNTKKTSAESTKKDFISASKEAKNNSQNIDSLLRTSYSSDKATKIAESSVNSAPKSEILSNLLRGRNEENLKDKSSPLDMILSRPQATQTKLNQTPEVVNSQNLAVKNQSREAQPLKASSGEGEGVALFFRQGGANPAPSKNRFLRQKTEAPIKAASVFWAMKPIYFRRCLWIFPGIAWAYTPSFS